MRKYRIYYREVTNNVIDIEADTEQEAIAILRNNTFINGPYVDSCERKISSISEFNADGECWGIIGLSGFKRD